MKDETPLPPIEEIRNCTINATSGNNTLINGTNLNVTNLNSTGLNSTNGNVTDIPCTYTVLVPSNETRNVTLAEMVSPLQDFAAVSSVLKNVPMNTSSVIDISVIPVDIFGTDRQGTLQTVNVNPPGPSVQGTVIFLFWFAFTSNHFRNISSLPVF